MTDYKVIKFMRNGVEYCLPKPGGDTYCLDYLVVAGGGGGGANNCISASYGGGGGGGGGGGVQLGTAEKFTDTVMNVCVGKGGAGGDYSSATYNYYGYCYLSCNGGGSSLGKIYAAGGGAGGGNQIWVGRDGGSGGGASTIVTVTMLIAGGISDGKSIGHDGGDGTNVYYAGGGGGAGTKGGIGVRGGYTQCAQNCTCCEWAHGGSAIYTDITGKEEYFAAGGGAGGYCGCGSGGFGAGNAGCCGSNATCCGAGGGGGYNRGGCGAGGIVVVRYPKDGSYGITNAIGGCKYECGDYCIHCFTQDGYFAINPTGCHISYLAVGGGGGCYYGGGGGGAVCFGTKEVTTNSINIVVGAGGCNCAGCKGGDTCIGEDIVAKGGEAGYCCGSYVYGGKSGSGCLGGKYFYSCSNQRPGGGGASSSVYGFDPRECCKVPSTSCRLWERGGFGYFGFGGGGRADGNGLGRDGGAGDGMMTYGGGGGRTLRSCLLAGYPGVVDICYPIDGSYGFTTATGGNCCYQCGDMCVHRFTSDGTFTIVS